PGGRPRPLPPRRHLPLGVRHPLTKRAGGRRGHRLALPPRAEGGRLPRERRRGQRAAPDGDPPARRRPHRRAADRGPAGAAGGLLFERGRPRASRAVDGADQIFLPGGSPGAGELHPAGQEGGPLEERRDAGRRARQGGGVTGERTSARSRVRGGLRRGAYLLPSLFTIGNMVLGFYAIVCGLDGQFLKAALLVFLAGFVDLLDGRIARMTGTESEFGREYDSLADVITFGATPGLRAYFWGLREFARDAWLLCVFYMVCAATRLARFNVQTRVVDSRFFVGLPMPAAAGAICSLLVFAPEYASDRDLRRVMQVVMGLALLLVGVLMVST